MTREYTFVLTPDNQVLVNWEQGKVMFGVYISAIECDHDDAELIRQAMQLAVNAKVEYDKTQSNSTKETITKH